MCAGSKRESKSREEESVGGERGILQTIRWKRGRWEIMRGMCRGDGVKKRRE